MSTATLPRSAADSAAAPPEVDEPQSRPILVPGTRSDPPSGPVLAALDDDGNVGAVLRHGAAMAAELGVALRVTYVWSDCRPPDCSHHRRCHRDLDEASHLLAQLIDEHLSVHQARRVERDVVHDGDPAKALVALSVRASVLVVGSSSHRPAPGEAFGGTTRALVGATRCPLVVVPHRRQSATRVAW